MTQREEYQIAFREAQHAKVCVEGLLGKAHPALVQEVDGWKQGTVGLIGPVNNWRDGHQTKSFDARNTPQRREIGAAISAWYSAMSLVEIKWGAFRHAEPLATDPKEPDSLTR
ncbi:MAG: hypothetical protein ACYDC3_11725 [Candidatus Binataceae bacterium]